MIKTNIIVKLQIDGTHQWSGVKKDHNLFSVFFLANPHRHMFHIVAKKEVSHGDRDIEIINLKRNIQDYLHNHYYNTELRTHEFKEMSCEMIASVLAKVFGLCYCEVLEDGENGAEVFQDTIIMTEEFKQKIKRNPSPTTHLSANGQYVIIYETK